MTHFPSMHAMHNPLLTARQRMLVGQRLACCALAFESLLPSGESTAWDTADQESVCRIQCIFPTCHVGLAGGIQRSLLQRGHIVLQAAGRARAGIAGQLILVQEVLRIRDGGPGAPPDARIRGHRPLVAQVHQLLIGPGEPGGRQQQRGLPDQALYPTRKKALLKGCFASPPRRTSMGAAHATETSSRTAAEAAVMMGALW